jgi:glycerate-2-kinase
MNETKLITALELLDEFLGEQQSALVWLVVGGGSALLVQPSAPARPRMWT